MLRWRLLTTVLLCSLCCATDAAGQVSAGARLTARIRSVTTTARANAPMTLVCELNWTGVELLEGYLDFTVRDGQELLGHVRGDDLVVQTGDRKLLVRLPALTSDGLSPQITIDARFVTEDRTFPLGEYYVLTQPFGTRRMMIGVCDPWEFRMTPGQSNLLQGLRLERFNPEEDNTSLSSSFGHVAPNEMPADALGYCVFNLLVLMDEGFAELREKQLEAIYDWTAAGGSLCVMPGSGLSDAHAAFLNRLAARESGENPFLTDGEGRLMTAGDGAETEFRLLHPGMGRAAVVISAGEADRDSESVDWRRMVAFLWNVKTQHVDQLIQRGAWDPGELFGSAEEMAAAGASPWQRFQHRLIAQGGWLLDRLKPEAFEVVPLSLIGLILFGYVLLIGPVDYFFLGALKRRKLTWVLFPLVTFGVTLFTVWLSQWYMQPSDERRTVEFLDVGDDGGIVRRSRFELILSGAPQNVETEVTGELFAPIDHQRYRSAEMYYGRYPNQYGAIEQQEQLVGPADFAGRIPARYTVAQQIPQWTPQINRFFAIAPKMETADAAEARFDWKAIAPPIANEEQFDLTNAAWHKRIRHEVERRFGAGASAWVIVGEKPIQSVGDSTLFAHSYFEKELVPAYRMTEGITQIDAGNFLLQTSLRPKIGLFALVSKIAPTGGDNFEDLPVLDPTDPRQCLVVVAVEEGSRLVIYRKLYIAR